MTKNLFASAVFAGVIAGTIAAALQLYFVIPVLLEGELYEAGQRVHFVVDGTTQSEAGAPSMAGEFTRHLSTLGFNVVTFSGFALILVALMSMAEGLGKSINARTGLLWGLSGFLAFHLAPAAGLPPELPGTVGAEVGARQIWWSITILATAIGIGLIALTEGWKLPVIGAVLILLPHLYGAPHLDTYFGVAPPELAGHFTTISMGVAAVSWTILGCLTGLFWSRFTAE